MESRAITALFDDYEEAAKAIDRIEAEGIPHADISVVGLDNGGRESGRVSEAAATSANAAVSVDEPAAGAGAGAAVGSVLGGSAGLLAGLGLVVIPGLGPVVAAGWLAATLTGAGVGAAAGGLLGALTGAGLSDAEAETYAEGVRRGGTLVTVKVDPARSARVVDLLKRSGSIDLDERVRNWRDQGWGVRSSGASRTGGRTAALPPDDARGTQDEDSSPVDDLRPHREPKPVMDPMEAPTTRQHPDEIR